MDVIDAEFKPLAVREDPRALATPMPTVSPTEAREAMRQYIEVCDAVLTADDYQRFKQWDPVVRAKVEKKFKKKSAVKKLQTFWGITVSVRDVQRDDLGDGNFGFRCVATATTPSGRFVEATGGCSTFEERFTPKRYDGDSDQEYATKCRLALARSYHDVMSTAETRATNRAVMNCIGVGGGEVTADEISRERDPKPKTAPAPRAPSATDVLIERARSASAIPAGDREQGMIALRNWAKEQGIEWGAGAAGKISAALDNLEASRSLSHELQDVAASSSAGVAPVPGAGRDEPGPSTAAVRAAADIRSRASEVDATNEVLATAAQRAKAMAMHGEAGHGDDDRRALYRRLFGKSSFKDLSREEVGVLITHLSAADEPEPEPEWDAAIGGGA